MQRGSHRVHLDTDPRAKKRGGRRSYQPRSETTESGSLLTRGGQPKTLSERSTAVARWVDGHLHAPVGLVQAKYSELAEAFLHILRAVNSAGLYDQLLAMLVELLTNRAVDRAEGDD